MELGKRRYVVLLPPLYPQSIQFISFFADRDNICMRVICHQLEIVFQWPLLLRSTDNRWPFLLYYYYSLIKEVYRGEEQNACGLWVITRKQHLIRHFLSCCVLRMNDDKEYQRGALVYQRGRHLRHLSNEEFMGAGLSGPGLVWLFLGW